MESYKAYGTIGVLWLLCSGSAVVTAENWSQFRGENADGIANSRAPIRWQVDDDTSQNIAWKVAVDGEGWSSPIVWGDAVFLTTAIPIVEGDASASTRPAEYTGGGGRRRSDLTDVVYRYQVICLDAATGASRWSAEASRRRPPIPRHSSNTYATETPVTDGQRVYAYFGMTGVYCFDMQGALLWEKDLGAFEMRAGWGTSSSPVLYDDKLFLQIDNEQQSFVIALDAETGEQVWRVDREEKSQYSTPVLWRNSLRHELIAGGMHCRSYDPKTGELLWELDMAKGRSSASPLAVGDRLYVGTELRNRGGPDDGGGFLFAIQPGGSGDITPKADEDSSEFVLWKTDKSNIQMASPAICDQRLYFLERRSGNLHCLDADTGQLVYRERIRGARAFWASPVTAGGRVYCLDANGTTYVIGCGGEYELLSRNEIDERTWSSPAVAGGKLYLRTIDHVYCIASD